VVIIAVPGQAAGMGFVSGLELNRRFYDELVAPLLAARFPDLRYAAARLDFGSELLGFDTPRSTDHDWGPRVQLFLDRSEPALAAEIVAAFSAELPPTFLDHPTRFAQDATTSFGVLSAAGDRHGVTVSELGAWFEAALGFDPRRRVSDVDWLSAPTQRLAEFTGGAIFHDGLDGTLTGRASGCGGTPTTCGGTCWPVNGPGSLRRSTSWAGAARSATSWAARWWRDASPGT
jgi:hypothetical protein